MLGLLPNSLYTSHKGESGGRGLSPRIWADIAGQALSPDGASNLYMQADDFCNLGTPAANYYVSQGGMYTAFLDTNATIPQLETEVGGVARLTTTAVDNECCFLQAGSLKSVFGKITSSSGKKLAFEARIRLPVVTDSIKQTFVGLTEEGLAADNGLLLDTDGGIASKDMIGFYTSEAAGSSLKFVYRKAGQAVQTVLTYGTALAANTFYKVGFLFDPSAPTSKRIKIFVDNVEQSTYVTGTNISAATFPDGEELGFSIGVKNAAATATHLDLDWYAVAQAG